jgi:hypothetical protein
MTQFNDEVFIEAIKSSKSPKLAYNSAKTLYEGVQDFSHVGESVIESAWADARRFGRAKQRKKGDHFRKERVSLDDAGVESEAKKILKSKNPIKHLSRILVQLDDDSLTKLYSRISTLFEQS